MGVSTEAICNLIADWQVIGCRSVLLHMTCCCGVFFGRSQARSPTEAGLGIFLRPTPVPFHRQVCLLLYSSCFTNVQLTRWFSCCCIYPLLWAGLLGEDLGDGLNCVQVKTCCDHTQVAESSGPLSFASHVCILCWCQE